MPLPVVSAVLPTYQRRDMALRAVRSVLAQRFEPFELVVADDGSTDGTAERVEALGDPRVRVVRIEHGGVSRARNAAIAAGGGRIVAFIDSDDRWLPDHLATIAAMFERRPEAVLATTALQDATIGRQRPHRTRLFDPMPRLLIASFVGPPSCVAVRRDALEQAGGFYEDFHVGEETDLYRRLALVGPFASLRRRTGIIQVTRGSLSRRPANRAEAVARFELSLSRLAEDVRRSPRAAELGPRLEGSRLFLESLAALAAGEEADAASRLRRARGLLPELGSEPVLVLGRSFRALRYLQGNGAGALETLARIWPEPRDETAAALRALASLGQLAARRPARAARLARGLPARQAARVARGGASAALFRARRTIESRIYQGVEPHAPTGGPGPG